MFRDTHPNLSALPLLGKCPVVTQVYSLRKVIVAGTIAQTRWLIRWIVYLSMRTVNPCIGRNLMIKILGLTLREKETPGSVLMNTHQTQDGTAEKAIIQKTRRVTNFTTVAPLGITVNVNKRAALTTVMSPLTRMTLHCGAIAIRANSQKISPALEKAMLVINPTLCKIHSLLDAIPTELYPNYQKGFPQLLYLDPEPKDPAHGHRILNLDQRVASQAGKIFPMYKRDGALLLQFHQFIQVRCQ